MKVRLYIYTKIICQYIRHLIDYKDKIVSPKSVGEVYSLIISVGISNDINNLCLGMIRAKNLQLNAARRNMKTLKFILIVPLLFIILLNPLTTHAYVIDVLWSYPQFVGDLTKSISTSALLLGFDDVNYYCGAPQDCNLVNTGNNYWPASLAFSIKPEQGDSLVGDVKVQWDFSGFYTNTSFSYYNMSGSQNENQTSFSIALLRGPDGVPLNTTNIDGKGSYVFAVEIGKEYLIDAYAHSNVHVIGAWSTLPTLIDENSYGYASCKTNTFAGSSSLFILSEPATLLLFGIGIIGPLLGRRMLKRQCDNG